MSKKKKNTALKVVLLATAVLGVTGGAIAIAKTVKPIEEETETRETERAVKQNFRSFDFTNKELDDDIDETNAVDFFNSCCTQNKNVFSELTSFDDFDSLGNLIYSETLGIVFGDGEDNAWISLDCVNNYKFNKVKVSVSSAVNDEFSIIGINGKELIINPSEEPVVYSKQINFDYNQTKLEIVGALNIPCITKLEMWSE